MEQKEQAEKIEVSFEKREAMSKQLDYILLSHRIHLELAKMLLENVFVYWNGETNNEADIAFKKRYEKALRKYIIENLYEMLCKKQREYFLELHDFDKTNDYHTEIQKRVQNIIELAKLIDKKDFHDEIIYFMDILS
jgi:hypothetical protein